MTARVLDRATPATAGRPVAALPAFLRELLARLQERLAEHRRYRQTVRELMSLTDRELDDIGIRRWQIREIARETARRKT